MVWILVSYIEIKCAMNHDVIKVLDWIVKDAVGFWLRLGYFVMVQTFSLTMDKQLVQILSFLI